MFKVIYKTEWLKFKDSKKNIYHNTWRIDRSYKNKGIAVLYCNLFVDIDMSILWTVILCPTNIPQNTKALQSSFALYLISKYRENI